MYIAYFYFLLAYGAGRLTEFGDVAGCNKSKDLCIYLFMYVAYCYFLLAYGAGRLTEFCDVAGCKKSNELFMYLCMLPIVVSYWHMALGD